MDFDEDDNTTEKSYKPSIAAPLDGEDDDRPFFGGGGTTLAPRRSINQGVRSYKCPNCGGEFNHWHSPTDPRVDKVCPFCSLEQGEYDPEDSDDG